MSTNQQDQVELQQMNAAVCLEMGSGSGIVSAALAHILGPSILYITTDSNIHACAATSALLTSPHRQRLPALITIHTTFADSLLPRIAHKVDVQVFNFPYVPTSDEEHGEAKNKIAAAWSGGASGGEIIREWQRGGWLERLGSRGGVCYLVLVEQNGVNSLIDWVNQEVPNWEASVVLKRTAGREKLSIVKCRHAEVRVVEKS